ncbi:MAG: 2-oxoacid:acceptor oxidoreductase subunit alpha [Candidatus Nealsonbacteria bacterium]
MTKTILIGGAAGLGSAVTSNIIGKVFCSLGYYVFNYRDYPSLIRGGHNFNVLQISDKPVYSHEEKYDIILALDQKTINLHQANLKKNGFLVGDKSLNAKKLYSIDTQAVLNKLCGPKILENDIFIGYLCKIFGINEQIIFKVIDKEFKKKTDLIKKAVTYGYGLAEKKEEIKTQKKENYFISGNEGIALGALAGGADICFAYPMTPATAVLHILAKKELTHNILAVQMESEIAVINTALGASFAGARVIVPTSGGGFALMTEAISLAGMAELPIVVYLAQRAAPSTGVPTYTAQGDLKFALNAGHGEFPKIVLAPGDPQESISRTEEAFYLSSKYRVPVIILSDKHLGESTYTFDQLKQSKLGAQRFLLKNPLKNYKSYQITPTGVSPAAVPGQGPVVRGTSYEHDDYGFTIEDAAWIVKMQDKRLKKIRYITQEVNRLCPVSIYGKGKNLLVGWGSTKGAILDALPKLKGFRFMQISYLSPFPKEKVLKEIKSSNKVVLVENTATGLLADVIAEQTGYIIKDKVLRYDARPFTSEFLIGKLIKK